MTDAPRSPRAEQRWQRRRRVVRQTALLLAVLLALASAFAVWLAVDARDPVPSSSGRAASAPV